LPFPFSRDLPFNIKLKECRRSNIKWAEYMKSINAESSHDLKSEKDLQSKIVSIETLAKVCNRLLDLFFSPPIYSIYKKDIKIDEKLNSFIDAIKIYQEKVKEVGVCIDDGN
jgi:hypothetical protein